MLHHLPNILSFLRLCLSVMFIALYAFNPAWIKIFLPIFLVAAVTDWIDGFLARTYGWHSSFGAFLDPLVDKVLTSVVLVLLVADRHDLFLAVCSSLIITRELLVNGLRQWALENNQQTLLKVSSLGKWKTAMQFFALTAYLAQYWTICTCVLPIAQTLLVMATVLSWWSGLCYLKALKKAHCSQSKTCS